MSFYKSIFVLFLIFSTQNSFSLEQEEIPLIGINDKGEEVVKRLPQKVFLHRFSNLMEIFQDALYPPLDKINNKKKEFWDMDQMRIGASLNFGLGLGEIIKGSIEPTFFMTLRKK